MADQQAPERIWFYADPIAGWLGAAKSFTTPDGVSPKPYVPLDLLEAAEKRIAELVAERNKTLQWAKKAEAERDTIGLEVGRLTAERDQALASVGAVIEKAAAVCENTFLEYRIRTLNPDATAALNEMLADAWDEGYTSGYHGRGRHTNPYRKAAT